MALPVSSLYKRETPEVEEGKPIMIVVYPPGNQIGFPLKGEKGVYTASIKELRAFVQAKQAKEEREAEKMRQAAAETGIKEKPLEVVAQVMAEGMAEVKSILEEQKDKKLHFNTLLKELESRDSRISKEIGRQVLLVLKRAGLVKQEHMEFVLQ